MKKLSIAEITEAVKGTLLKGNENIFVDGISTDTRVIEPNDAFFALVGENYDAHDLISNLDGSKCKVIVVEREDCIPKSFDAAIILVKDTTRAYQDLASYYKKVINPITIAITGSVGKTSLKDMTSHIVAKKYATVATEGNYNNQIGVPKTIFNLEEDTEILVLEMGMDHAGEIRRLVEIAEPTIAAISTIGVSHRENFDSDDGIFNAKMEVASTLGKGSSLIINGDDENLNKLNASKDIPYSIISVGSDATNDYMVSDVGYIGDNNLSFNISHGEDKVKYSLPVAGLYNGITAGMASAILSSLDIDMQFAAEALLDLKRTPHRLQLIKLNDIKIIDDVYNASPDSMKSALEYLMQIPGRRKIAILAGMNELGDESSVLHRQIGEAAVNMGVDVVICVGEKARDIAEGAVRAQGYQSNNSTESHYISNIENLKIFSFRNNADASAFISLHKNEGDVYLIKGSRGMKTEEIVSSLVGEKND